MPKLIIIPLGNTEVDKFRQRFQFSLDEFYFTLSTTPYKVQLDLFDLITQMWIDAHKAEDGIIRVLQGDEFTAHLNEHQNIYQYLLSLKTKFEKDKSIDKTTIADLINYTNDHYDSYDQHLVTTMIRSKRMMNSLC